MSSDKASIAQVDFLSAEFRQDETISRADGAFDVIAPWAVARFGEIRLAAGWWSLEHDGEAPPEALEVRLSAADDPLILFKGARAAGRKSQARIYLRSDRSFHVALQVAGWPGRYEFGRLRLRRQTVLEDLRMYFGSMLRLLRSPAQVRRAWRLVAHMASGRTVGMKAGAGDGGPTRATTVSAVAEPAADVLRVVVRSVAEGIDAALGEHDQLDPRAPDLIAAMFARRPDLQAVYADAAEGGVVQPRPGWDPELARSWDYGGPPVFFRNGDVRQVWDAGGLGAVDARWGAGAVALAPLPLVQRAERTSAVLEKTPRPQLAARPPVSVIIPTKLRIDLLEKCLTGLARNTDYPAFEAVVVDNGSEDPRLPKVLGRARDALNLVCVEDPRPFNFSRLINCGVGRASHDLLVIFNDDVEPIEAGWLDRMVESLLRPDVGCVGARLTYPDGSIQHAGVSMGLGGICGHLFRDMPPEQAVRNASVCYPGQRVAVTGACLGVRRDVFDQVRGLDEGLPVALNDIDFCLRVRREGYKNMYRGDAVLIHHESQTRGHDDVSEEGRLRLIRETGLFMERWRRGTENDPFLSALIDSATEAGAVRPTGI